MSDTRAHEVAPRRRGWAGVMVFAAFMMIMTGVFQAIAGLAALFNDDYYRVTASGHVLDITYSVWGWVHLALGAVLLLAGFGVLNGTKLAREIGVVCAVLSATVALAFSPADPAWAVLVITIDVLVIYALTVHGHALDDAL
ncbi:DUF7144 family membrane protein [Geodermatophilus sp. SYSU D00815]